VRALPVESLRHIAVVTEHLQAPRFRFQNDEVVVLAKCAPVQSAASIDVIETQKFECSLWAAGAFRDRSAVVLEHQHFYKLCFSTTLRFD
jgi:hypothetical protein